MKKIDELTPWYINNSLDHFSRAEISHAIENSNSLSSEVEYWRKISQILRNRPYKSPTENVLASLMHEIHSKVTVKSKGSRVVIWLSGIVSAILLLILLWQFIQPGVSLQWSVNGDLPQVFRVYRAREGGSDFVLQKEIYSVPDNFQYRYVDLLLVPGESYIYIVEGVGTSGSIVLSQNLVIPPLAAFPAQFAIILTSLAGGFALATIVETITLSNLNQRHLPI